MEISYADFTTAFLNGILQEDLYIMSPEGTDDPPLLLKLQKALYGLKQASAEWYKAIRDRLIELGYHQVNYDESVFVRIHKGVKSFAWLYVDDLLLFTAKDRIDNISSDIAALRKHYKMKDPIHFTKEIFLLGIIIQRDRKKRTISLRQHKHIEALLARFPLTKGYHKTPISIDVNSLIEDNSVITDKPYRELIGM